MHMVKGHETLTPVVGSAITGFNPQLAGPLQVDLPIVNLDCATCVVTIERTLNELDGVKKASVNFATGKSHIVYDPARVALPDIERAIKKVGYNVGGAKTQIGIRDLRCAPYVTFIEDTLKATPGVLKATVNVAAQQADIEYLPGMTMQAALRRAIESTSYKTASPAAGALAAGAPPEDAERTARLADYRDLRNRFVFAAVIEFAPEKPGEYDFQCRMGVLHGKLSVE
jgi:cation transport ATPase